MTSMNSYMPVRLYTGTGCVKLHKDEFAKAGNICLIVTGKQSAKACGAYDDAVEVLNELHIPSILFDGIGQNPALTDCMRAAELLQKALYSARPTELSPFILGIGGGSPLDAAKCIAVLAANPGMTQAELYSRNWHSEPYPVLAIGTTAGTGSEVTKVSVITLPNGRKKSFHDEAVFPYAAFGDPRYTMTLPLPVTASTAIDAFAHSMESYFSRSANELSQFYAVRGMRILLPLLKKIAMLTEADKKADESQSTSAVNTVSTAATEDVSASAAETAITLEEREQLYHASVYGGLAINITGTCLPHTMGYLLTEQHSLPHGFACAVFLKAFLQHNRACMPDLTAAFLQALDTTEADLTGLFDRLLADCRPVITEEEIRREHSRWINNGSINKTWGNVTPEQCDEILRSVSVE